MVLFIVTTTVFLTFLSFHARLHLHPRHFLHFVTYLLRRRNGQSTQDTHDLRGKLTDTQTGSGVSQAAIYMYAENDTIIAHTETANNGSFLLRGVAPGTHKLLVMRNGYVPLTLHKDTSRLAIDGELVLSISQHDRFSLFSNLKWLTHEAGIVVFDALLLLSIINEIWLGATLGWMTAAPFIALSGINLLLWMLHLRHTWGK